MILYLSTMKTLTDTMSYISLEVKANPLEGF